MQWVLDNWVWILLGGGMIAMHLFGHGGHGGHGKSADRSGEDDVKPGNGADGKKKNPDDT